MKRFVLSILTASLAAAASGQTAAPAPTPAPSGAPAAAVPPSAPAVTHAPASGVPKIAVINVERLVQESALGKEAFARVKKVSEQKKEEADKLTKELREMEQKLADQGASLADDKKEALQKTYQEKAIAFKRFQDDAQRTLEEAQKKELAQLESRVMPVISQVGRERGFSMIFNKFQSGLVYADEASDVTDEVLKRFNTTVAVPAAASKEPAGDAATKPKTTPKKPS